MTATDKLILVVDDEPTAQALMCATLECAGYSVRTANDGEDALRQFRATHFDMVMLDVEMPGLTGFEVCAALRAEIGPLLPIVMVTGLDDVASVDAAYSAGATDFIAKPISWALVGHRVRYLLRTYQAMLDLRSAEARNAAVLGALPDLLFELDLEGRYLQYHAARLDVVQAPASRFIGRTVHEVLAPEAAQVCLEAVAEAHATGLSTGRECELLSPTSGAWFELSVSRRLTGDGLQPQFIVLARDVTERRLAQSRIHRLAYYDSLTALPNREQFRSRLNHSLAQAAQQRQQLALLWLDLDNFKRVNDTLGHSVGDELLRTIAQRLAEALGAAEAGGSPDGRAQESFARMGGDEFAVMMPVIEHRDEAEMLANRIICAIMRPMLLGGHEVLITPSVGLAIYPTDGEDAETLLRNADLAMYFSKRHGPGSCAFFEPNMNANALQRLTVESKLRGAIAAGELSLHYQPQLDLNNGNIAGLEALLRWNNADLGQVPPEEFIPVAEETGLILPIGDWVMRAACMQTRAWLDEGLPVTRMAVNVSAVQLYHRGFPDRVEAIMRETGMPPGLLEIEVTESAVIRNEGLAAQTLHSLKQIGVGIAIDDFGTGHSSLGRLRQFPIDRLKIDRTFVHRVHSCAADRAIATAIIAMARTLQFDVVAEGVEQMEQLLVLQEERCAKAQGFLLSRPMPANEALQLLRRLATQNDAGSRTQRLSRLLA
jgi:diguanylate cyclase (GGDEF)-like protein